MTTSEICSERAAPLPRPVELAAFALVIGHTVYLAACILQGVWLIGPDGHGIPSDFVNVWAAGRLVLEGLPTAAYDWPTHKAAENMALGHEFDGYFGWHYPPTFLFAAASLALMPYAVAYGLWTFGTFPAYLAAIRAIVGARSGYLLAAAFPAVLCNFIVGQNGFLSAGLLGGALVMLERRPLVAGLLFGVLAYKPHLGLLVPLALIAGGYWRAFGAATLTATLIAAASCAAFGLDTWQAFIASVGHTSQAFLSNGWADFGKLQTAFGLVRTLGGSEALAWRMQAGVAVIAATGVAALWRSRADVARKAAGLGTGALLATPYLYTYDLVVLAVPLAFLFRLGRTGGFARHEPAAIALACLLILAFPFVTAPVGFVAVLIVATLVAARCRFDVASHKETGHTGRAGDAYVRSTR